jgi:hypothetical protein
LRLSRASIATRPSSPVAAEHRQGVGGDDEILKEHELQRRRGFEQLSQQFAAPPSIPSRCGERRRSVRNKFVSFQRIKRDHAFWGRSELHRNLFSRKPGHFKCKDPQHAPHRLPLPRPDVRVNFRCRIDERPRRQEHTKDQDQEQIEAVVPRAGNVGTGNEMKPIAVEVAQNHKGNDAQATRSEVSWRFHPLECLRKHGPMASTITPLESCLGGRKTLFTESISVAQ